MITSNFALHQGGKYIVETFVEKEEMGHDKQFCSRLLHMRQRATDCKRETVESFPL